MKTMTTKIECERDRTASRHKANDKRSAETSIRYNCSLPVPTRSFVKGLYQCSARLLTNKWTRVPCGIRRAVHSIDKQSATCQPRIQRDKGRRPGCQQQIRQGLLRVHVHGQATTANVENCWASKVVSDGIFSVRGASKKTTTFNA